MWFILFVVFVYTLCGASALRSIELQISFSETAVQGRMLGYMIWFVQTFWDRTSTVLKLHCKNIGHLYDIDIWD